MITLSSERRARLYKDHYNPVAWGTGGIAYSVKTDYSPGTRSPPVGSLFPGSARSRQGPRQGLRPVVKSHPIRLLPSTSFCVSRNAKFAELLANPVARFAESLQTWLRVLWTVQRWDFIACLPREKTARLAPRTGFSSTKKGSCVRRKC